MGATMVLLVRAGACVYVERPFAPACVG